MKAPKKTSVYQCQKQKKTKIIIIIMNINSKKQNEKKSYLIINGFMSIYNGYVDDDYYYY